MAYTLALNIPSFWYIFKAKGFMGNDIVEQNNSFVVMSGIAIYILVPRFLMCKDQLWIEDWTRDLPFTKLYEHRKLFHRNLLSYVI